MTKVQVTEAQDMQQDKWEGPAYEYGVTWGPAEAQVTEADIRAANDFADWHSGFSRDDVTQLAEVIATARHQGIADERERAAKMVEADPIAAGHVRARIATAIRKGESA